MSFRKIFDFYYDGFANMSVGKTLWRVIFIKLAIILIFLNYFIDDKSLKSEYKTEEQRANLVYENMRLK